MASRFTSGNNQGVKWASHPTVPATVPITLSAWVRRLNNTNVSMMSIFDIDNNNASVSEIYLYLNQASAGANVTVGVSELQGGAGNVAVASTSQIPFGPWTHVCATVDVQAAGATQLYVNGVVENSGSSSFTSSPAFSTMRVNTNFAGGVLRGWAAEAFAWNAILTPTEVRRLAAGVNPLQIRPASLFFGAYPRGLKRNDRDVVSGFAGSIVGTVSSTQWGDDPFQYLRYGKRRRVGTAGSSVVNVSGTTTLVFTPTSTIVGRGVVSGSSTLVFSPSAGIVGMLSASGSSSLVVSPSGTVSGIGVSVGSSSVVFSGSGTPSATGTLVGTSAATFACSASIVGSGFATGSSSVTFSSVASLSALVQASGSSSLSFGLTAEVLALGDVTGDVHIAFTASSSASASGSLAGSSGFALSSVSALTGLAYLNGNVQTVFSVQGSVYGLASLSGNSAVVFSGLGDVSSLVEVIGSCGLVFSSSGSLIGRTDLSASTSLTFATAGDVFGSGVVSGSTGLEFLASLLVTRFVLAWRDDGKSRLISRNSSFCILVSIDESELELFVLDASPAVVVRSSTGKTAVLDSLPQKNSSEPVS